MAISLEIRDQVVAAVLSGATCRAAASQLGVSVGSAVRWVRRYRLYGSSEKAPHRGGRRPVLDHYRDFIVGRIAEGQSLTLHKLKDELSAHGVSVSHNAVWRFLKREGLSLR